MGRRGGVRKSGMSHSIKKLMRRSAATGHLVKNTKAKSREPRHPGAKVVSFNAKRRAAAAGEEGEKQKMGVGSLKGGTERRIEMRKAMSKQARLEETARRRGIVPDVAAKASASSEVDDEATTAAANAAKRALAFAPNNQRAFHKELATVLKSADVLLEVLDARDPMGCRCIALEDAVLAKCRGKRVVLVLNKVDLVPADITQRWLSYLRQYFPTLPFKATTQGKRDVSSSNQSAAVGKLGAYGAEAYGGDGLLQLLKNYSRSLGMKTAITVGIVGYPNVGKSSLINSLKRAKAVNVGATPGVTTVAQTIALDSKVKLMDCPGIIFARAHTAEEQADVSLRNCVRVEKLEDPTVPVEAILRKVPAEQLMRQYDVGSFASALELLTLIAVKRGLLRKGGAADQDAAARVVLHDWNGGSIKYHTEPPKPTGGVALVPRLAGTFDWDAAPRVVDGVDEEDAGEGAAANGKATTDAVKAAGGAAADMAADSAEEDGEEEMEEEGEKDDEATEGGVGGARRLLRGWSEAQDREKRPKKEKKHGPSKRVLSVTLTDDEKFNFQFNRGIRKTQKADKKKARKRAAAASMLLE